MSRLLAEQPGSPGPRSLHDLDGAASLAGRVVMSSTIPCTSRRASLVRGKRDTIDADRGLTATAAGARTLSLPTAAATTYIAARACGYDLADSGIVRQVTIGLLQNVVDVLVSRHRGRESSSFAVAEVNRPSRANRRLSDTITSSIRYVARSFYDEGVACVVSGQDLQRHLS